MQAVTEFLKNASLLTLLTILITVISIIVGLVALSFGRGTRPMSWLFGLATLPLLVGFLATYVDNRQLDSGHDPFGTLRPEAIAAGRRDALITAGIGIVGALVVGLMGLSGLKKNGRAETSKRSLVETIDDEHQVG